MPIKEIDEEGLANIIKSQTEPLITKVTALEKEIQAYKLMSETKFKGLIDVQHADTNDLEDDPNVVLFAEVNKKSTKSVARLVRLGRFMKASINCDKNNLPRASGLEFLKARHPEDKITAGLYEKSIGQSAGIGSEGGFTIPTVLASEIIPYLYPKSAFISLGMRKIPVESGNLTIPRLDVNSIAYYEGELQQPTASKTTIGDVKFNVKKLMALIPISNDLLRSTSIDSDLFITNDVVIIIALKIDNTCMYGAGTAYAPAGLNVLMAPANKIGATTTALDSTIPAYALGILMAKNIPMISPGWIFNGYIWSWLFNLKTTTGAFIYRDEMKEGKLLGHPFKVSNQIVNGGTTYGTDLYSDFWVGDFSELMLGEQLPLEVTMSREASYTDSNGVVQSAFAKDFTLLRAISIHDFQMRHTLSFVKGTYAMK